MTVRMSITMSAIMIRNFPRIKSKLLMGVERINSGVPSSLSLAIELEDRISPRI